MFIHLLYPITPGSRPVVVDLMSVSPLSLADGTAASGSLRWQSTLNKEKEARDGTVGVRQRCQIHGWEV